ncbi:hypothetical protein [Polaromonas sp. JS666]|uniref:hypothetical protein n=1 Tax=Polaromonas sp. (strain JS666 / ATCC BAA-500) TaxID=296591 RepID=UPI00088F8857|nr:hypothetical protein [Polaromonas sp. JS666]SDM35539.1 hypothetical protein SAMN05720382_10179 [Polaromonas sp. JS666]
MGTFTSQPELPEKVALAFVDATAARWSIPQVELYEKEALVMVTVETLASDGKDIDVAIKQAVARALNKLIPPDSDHKFGLWMVVFCCEGHVYDTIHPSEFND